MGSLRPVAVPVTGRSILDIWRATQHLPGLCFLDSSDAHSKWSRYSILAVLPHDEIMGRGAEMIRVSDEDVIALDTPFHALRGLDHLVDVPADWTLPFVGGWMGYMGFEASRYLRDFKHFDWPATGVLPDIWFGWYDRAVIADHATGELWFVGLVAPEEELEPFDEWFGQFLVVPDEPALSIENVTFDWENAKFVSAIRNIQRDIKEGQYYQMNLSHPFHARYTGDVTALYATLRKENPGPYSAHLNVPGGHIFCSSPEQFFSVSGGDVVSRPIKGTVARGKTNQDDVALQSQLLRSEKDRAELLMIVDLIRNDLGHVCDPGSIEVPELYGVESFASVHHLVSTITGQLTADTSPIDVLKALFPGGSITGAPKIRSVEAIHHYETGPRSIYTGTIGYISAHGHADFNIAIRTLYADETTLYGHSGGGITVGSDAQAEWEETGHKMEKLIQSLRHFGG
ncbi:MAG: aminodeoxychorismate synthase component I [bacterium]|nr:aminodeoxychorismate synthase component I [bacterium]